MTCICLTVCLSNYCCPSSCLQRGKYNHPLFSGNQLSLPEWSSARYYSHRNAFSSFLSCPESVGPRSLVRTGFFFHRIPVSPTSSWLGIVRKLGVSITSVLPVSGSRCWCMKIGVVSCRSYMRNRLRSLAKRGITYTGKYPTGALHDLLMLQGRATDIILMFKSSLSLKRNEDGIVWAPVLEKQEQIKS